MAYDRHGPVILPVPVTTGPPSLTTTGTKWSHVAASRGVVDGLYGRVSTAIVGATLKFTVKVGTVVVGTIPVAAQAAVTGEFKRFPIVLAAGSLAEFAPGDVVTLTIEVAG